MDTGNFSKELRKRTTYIIKIAMKRSCVKREETFACNVFDKTTAQLNHVITECDYVDEWEKHDKKKIQDN